jgi:threonylcarbamoyladenosine tRNA methylthiotransferase MtaB
VSVVTLGCRSNLAEADGLARWAGPSRTVINSCAVTAAAVRDARKAAKTALKGGGEVWVTGCAAAVAPERFADLPVRLVEKPRALPAVTRQARAFVAVQDGCDHSCTFCVTRLARGPARSASASSVVDAVKAVVAGGVREVVLTGVDLSGWGAELSGRPTLGFLVERILEAVPELPRLRLSTLDPAEVDERLAAGFRDPRVMPHAHLSLQAGDDLVLRRMRRRHSAARAVEAVAMLRAARADLALGADVIAGFPTEGEEAFARTRTLVETLGVVHAHVFPFSPRPGTAAARMPPVSADVAQHRARLLRDDAARRRERALHRLLGQPVAVVSEGSKGLSPHGFEVRFGVPRPYGRIVSVTPSAVRDGALCA